MSVLTKKYGRALLCVFLGVLLLFSLNACGDKDDKENSPSEAPTATTAPTATGTPTPTNTPTPSPTPTEIPFIAAGKNNILGIEGYEYLEKPRELDKEGDVLLHALTHNDAKYNGSFLEALTLYTCRDNAIAYQLTTREFSLVNPPDGQDPYASESTLYLGSVNAQTGDVREQAFDQSDTFFFELPDGFLSINYTSSPKTYTTYDFEMNQLHTVSYDGSSTDVSFSDDGLRYYYVNNDFKNFGLHAVDEQGNDRILNLTNFRVKSISEVFTDCEGNDYLFLSALGGDLMNYDIFVDAQTGMVIHTAAPYSMIANSQNGYYVETMWDDNNFIDYRWIIGGRNAYTDFVLKEEFRLVDNYLYPILLDEDLVLFSLGKENTLSLFLFNASTAELVDSVSLTVPEAISTSPDIMTGLYLTSSVLLEEGTLLLSAGDNAWSHYFFTWSYDTEPGEASIFDTGLYEIGSRETLFVESLYNIDIYTPRPHSDELSDFEARVKALEDRYGIVIYYGEECGNILLNYLLEPCTDYDLIDTAIRTLENEMAKYPDDFFLQLQPEGFSKSAFLLAGALTYIGDDNRSSTAAGFRADYNNMQIMVFDITEWGLNSTFHHELSHVIDDFLERKCEEDEDNYFTENGWLALNPPADIYGEPYSYTYSRYVLSDFIFETDFMLDREFTDSYYVDSYATTYPTEDRARLWENLMTLDFYYAYASCPALVAKLEYYIAGMEEAFDQTNWPEVTYWEEMMEQY